MSQGTCQWYQFKGGQNSRVWLCIIWWFKMLILEGNPQRGFWDICWCLIPVKLLKHGIHFLFLLPWNGQKFKGVGCKTSGEFCTTSTIYQIYPAFIVGYTSHNVAVGKLLPNLSTLGKQSRDGNFGMHHELDRELNNACIQLLVEIRFELRSNIKILPWTLV